MLCDDARQELIIAGRSLAPAQAFAAKLGGSAKANGQLFDRDGDVAAQLAGIRQPLIGLIVRYRGWLVPENSGGKA